MDPLLLPKSSVKTLSDDDEEDSRHDTLSLLNNNNNNTNNSNNTHTLRQEQEETWSLRVKALSRDVNILVRPHSDTVAAVKAAVRQALGPDVTSNRPYTRLVCKGRLLAPDAAKLKDLTVVQPNDVVHAVLSASANREGPQAALQRGLSQPEQQQQQQESSSSSSTTNSPGRRHAANHRRSRGGGPSRRAWRGAGINANGLAVRQTADSDTDDDDDATGDSDNDDDLENGTAMGFDRLRRAGLRRSDVVALRTYFGRSIDRFVRQNPEQTTFASETDAVRRRLLQEEAWMAAQGPLSEFRLNIGGGSGGASWTAGGGGGAAWNNTNTAGAAATRGGLSPSEALWRSGGLSAAVGTDRDFIWGFLLGFLVGLLMLVWVWMPSVPHKQKLGILTGISFQLALGMLRTSNGVDDNANHQYPVYEGDDYFFHD